VKADDASLAAKLGDWTLTKDFLYTYIDKLSDDQKKKYNSDAGRANLTDRFLAEQLYYRAALDKHLDRHEDVKKQFKDAKRRILINAYYNDFVQTAAEPNEEAIHDYYDANQDRYTSLAVARGQHIFSKDPQKLIELKHRIVDGGEKFTTLAHKYSEDVMTREDGGDLGYFNPGGYIRGIGFSKILGDTLFQLKVGQVVGPIKWEKGYSLVRINKRQDAKLRPYSDVRDDIVKVLTHKNIQKARDAVFAKLSKKYPARNLMREYFNSVQRSPRELFKLAQTATDPQKKIAAYQEVIDKFPRGDWAPKALFMIGFVYSEQLGDYHMADRTFNRVLNLYPDNPMADQAKYMMDNMGKKHPDFDTTEKKVRNTN